MEKIEFRTISDIGCVFIGNESFQVKLHNGIGDITNTIIITDNENIENFSNYNFIGYFSGNFNLYWSDTEKDFTNSHYEFNKNYEVYRLQKGTSCKFLFLNR